MFMTRRNTVKEAKSKLNDLSVMSLTLREFAFRLAFVTLTLTIIIVNVW
jgi:hypothetical protein